MPHTDVLRPARVLVVEPASSGGATLIGVAAEMGLRVVVATADSGDRRLSDAVRAAADSVLTVETNDQAALEAAVLELHRAEPFEAVLPGSDIYVTATARVAAALDLPGLPVATVDRVRDKSVMRAAVAEAGLRTPRFAQATTDAELRAAAERVGFPCVLKPVACSGSIHVSRADDLDQLTAAFQRLVTDPEPDMGKLHEHRVLVEEYVQGPEFSADGYVLESGEVIVVALSRTLLGPEPDFVELGHLTPALVDDTTLKSVEAYVGDVVRAVGITSGPFHCELRLAADGPVLIEIGARLPGDRIVELLRLVTGVSLPRVAVATALGVGLETAGAFARPQAESAGIRFFSAAGRSSYQELTGWPELEALPEVTETAVYFAPGETIPGVEDCRSRLGHALFTADSPQGALDRWQALGDLVVPA
ncbi:ATP-grasp domain-containing protein [Streptomyces sp. NBC_00249]|uniref:ATP-grasp domain-containing protein n=1 Tax=Streptomyces sp. NBC_00249 TaxID=2975690 RepID=UPI002255FEBF|nr:ATP-grasp domain-containing protein [Streptomyces sp. NBC_00249]MCX5195700.1 ATP-grasp domain-containing protein [Streptomyces sp. NBC_00249]